MVLIYLVQATTPWILGPLWLWQDIHVYATSPGAKRGYCRWFSFSVNPHKREDPVAFLANRHSDKYLGFPCRMSDTPPTTWQSDQPLGRVLMYCPGGPYVLPPSTLSQQHIRTSHAGLLTSKEFPPPTWGIN